MGPIHLPNTQQSKPISFPSLSLIRQCCNSTKKQAWTTLTCHHFHTLVKPFDLTSLVYERIHHGQPTHLRHPPFFFRKSFNLWRPLPIIALYHQTKTPISFWCRQGLNPRSLIQPSETLPVELTGTHTFAPFQIEKIIWIFIYLLWLLL